MRAFYTGDPHRSYIWLDDFCAQMKTTKDDVLVILGDAGINYYGIPKDDGLKQYLEERPITLLCIHGNHENRPGNIPTYREVEWNGGVVYREDMFPSILFAKDGEVYNIGGRETLVAGGAYSVNKPSLFGFAMLYGYGWWRDEQPSDEIKAGVEAALAARSWKIDTILTHTAPLKYEPVEMFLSCVDQTRVDKTTEKWLDSIEDRTDYARWLCGHYHTDKEIDRLIFAMFDTRDWQTDRPVHNRRKFYDQGFDS